MMKLKDWLQSALKSEKKVYKVELPVGDELSDGDRALIYGWPDMLIGENE